MIYELMIHFLENNFPIRKIKINGRFKRCIIIKTHQYLISDNQDLKNCSYELVSVLTIVFGINDFNLITDVIAFHLGIK